jgi:hypothetical protein
MAGPILWRGDQLAEELGSFLDVDIEAAARSSGSECGILTSFGEQIGCSGVTPGSV